MTTRVPLSRWDSLNYPSALREKWEHYRRLESMRKRIEEDDSGDEKVILDTIDMTTYIEETEDLGELE